VDRFYSIWKPLMLFVNQRRKIVPGMLPANYTGPWLVSEVVKLRDALWADDSLREAFIAENPASLPPADLAIVESWRQRRAGNFYVFKHGRQHSFFIATTEKPEVYGVIGLASPLVDVVPFVPCHVETVLLPFDGPIIYDSLIRPYSVTLGSSIRSSLENVYRDAKERGAILTSLLPTPLSPQEKQTKARATNTRVLTAFRIHLARLNLSSWILDRDLAAVTAFANSLLATPTGPVSLRDFGVAAVQGHVASGPPQESLVGLKRFLRFLRDTERMDPITAGATLDLLKGVD
jgi:hypothetical protein